MFYAKTCRALIRDRAHWRKHGMFVFRYLTYMHRRRLMDGISANKPFHPMWAEVRF
jgi:hypothetical protein